MKIFLYRLNVVIGRSSRNITHGHCSSSIRNNNSNHQLWSLYSSCKVHDVIRMKRSLSTTTSSPSKTKKPKPKPKPKDPEYTASTPVRDEAGEIIWPAPRGQIAKAQELIIECAKANKRTVIVPDKDADGLSSGVILQKTLQLLGLAADKIEVHLLAKGTTVHSDEERETLESRNASYIFVLDHGSRQSRPLIEAPHTALVIDHHFASPTDIPEGSFSVNACHSPPVATSSLLTYEICRELHPEVSSSCAWLCCIGTHGDLGNTLKWEPPFPDMAATFKEHTKKAINDAVSLLNAPRRTETYDVLSAWKALSETKTGPMGILNNTRLLAARAEINFEVERCTHTAPKFSKDATVAVFRISSKCQVHPVIATRWANHLSSKRLEIVMVVNTGYLPDLVNFSCRIARVARARGEDGRDRVDIIARLKALAAAHESGDLLERMGADFARGHVQASGGIVGQKEFDDLMAVMKVGEKPDDDDSLNGSSPTKRKKQSVAPPQKNTLENYFGKK